MFARNSQRAADLAMVGMILGPPAVAGLAFANIYYSVGNGFSTSLAGGTISQVSQRFGAGRHGELELAVKQGMWIGIAIAVPFTIVFWFFPDSLIGLFGAATTTRGFGSAYLQVISVAMVFNFVNTVSSRTLAGADDTWIAMTIRGTGAFANIIFNAIFIFGLGMGVTGAALGTVVAEGLVSACFIWGLVSGRLPIVGPFPVQVSPYRPYFDSSLASQLLKITPPLMGRRLARSVARFPLYAILATFGPTIVAAFEVARRVRSLMGTPGSGFSMAASSLVGQELGKAEETSADNYAWDVFWFSAAIYLTTGALVFIFARNTAQLFVKDPAAIDQVVPFIKVATISLVGKGLNKSLSGVLKAAGDNTWPMYGGFMGQYLFLLPLTYLGSVTPLGVVGVYLALIAETWSAGAITLYRFISGKWIEISRSYRPTVTEDTRA